MEKEETEMKIEIIDHVGIMVENAEKAKKFFEDLLGINFFAAGEVEETDVRSMISALGIEIFEPLTPEGPSRRLLKKKGEGLSLLSLRVQNLDEAMAEMQSHGIRLVKVVTRGKLRAAVYHPKDVHGVFLELVEIPPVHPGVAYFLEKRF